MDSPIALSRSRCRERRLNKRLRSRYCTVEAKYTDTDRGRYLKVGGQTNPPLRSLPSPLSLYPFPSFSLPLSLPPFTPSPSPPPFPFPSLPFPLPPFPSLRSRPPLMQLGGLGERCKLPSGVWGGAPAKIELGAF